MGTIHYLVDHDGKRALSLGKDWYEAADEANFTVADIDRYAAENIAWRAQYIAKHPDRADVRERDTRLDDIARRWLKERNGARIVLMSEHEDYPWQRYAPEPPPPAPWPSWLIRPPGWEPVREPTPDPEFVEGWVIDVPWLGKNCPTMDEGEVLYPPGSTGPNPPPAVVALTIEFTGMAWPWPRCDTPSGTTDPNFSWAPTTTPSTTTGGPPSPWGRASTWSRTSLAAPGSS